MGRLGDRMLAPFLCVSHAHAHAHAHSLALMTPRRIVVGALRVVCKRFSLTAAKRWDAACIAVRHFCHNSSFAESCSHVASLTLLTCSLRLGAHTRHSPSEPCNTRLQCCAGARLGCKYDAWYEPRPRTITVSACAVVLRCACIAFFPSHRSLRVFFSFSSFYVFL